MFSNVLGLICKMLDLVPEVGLAPFVLRQLKTLLSDLKRDVDLDRILKTWVDDTLTHRIVCSDLTQPSDPHSIPFVSINRLLSVVEVIRDKNMVAELVLKLFQVRVTENRTESDSPVKGPVCPSTAERLCVLAKRASEGVGASAREALAEAVRLLERRTLAAKYNISDFDPRDAKQVPTWIIISISNNCFSFFFRKRFVMRWRLFRPGATMRTT